MKRREVLQLGALLVVASAELLLLGCSDEDPAQTYSDNTGDTGDTGDTSDTGDRGDSGDAGDSGDTATCSTTTNTIVTAHFHQVTLSDTALAAGVAVTLTMTGGHDHVVSLSADHLATLAGCGMVVVTASANGNGHTHQVTFQGA